MDAGVVDGLKQQAVVQQDVRKVGHVTCPAPGLAPDMVTVVNASFLIMSSACT